MRTSAAIGFVATNMFAKVGLLLSGHAVLKSMGCDYTLSTPTSIVDASSVIPGTAPLRDVKVVPAAPASPASLSAAARQTLIGNSEPAHISGTVIFRELQIVSVHMDAPCTIHRGSDFRTFFISSLSKLRLDGGKYLRRKVYLCHHECIVL